MIVKRILYILCFITLAGCQSEYQKMLKTTDYEQQYNAAMKYYDQKDYLKAYELFDKVLPAYRLTDKAEKINYLIARCYYEEADYLMAAYYFERFVVTFPTSESAEEAYYFSALCYYYNSPKYSLDQANTLKAINMFQGYINKYSKGVYVKESNGYIAELRQKLEKKAFENSKIFFQIGDYKAAVVALDNCLKEYPDTKYREEILYLMIESSYLLAENSVEAKKQDRYESAIANYNSYIDEYPQGQWSKDAEKLYLQIKKRIN
jgi:outer membrane protein assembly factor BamD